MTSMVDQRRWTEFLFYPTGWVFGVIDIYCGLMAVEELDA